MPRRIRNAVDNANRAAVNANHLIANADSTLNVIDDIIDGYVEQGYIDLEVKPEFSGDAIRAIFTMIRPSLSQEQLDKLVDRLTPNMTIEVKINLPGKED